MALLQAVWEQFKRIGGAVGNFQARLLFSLFYWVLLPPFAALLRLFGDPLALRGPAGPTFWVSRPAPGARDASARRQW